MIFAMAKDFRVVLIACDRLHMQTMDFVRLKRERELRKKRLFMPIAARLGIYRLKSQLEDLSIELKK